LKKSDVFYDIGANVGFFSLLAAKMVGPTGKVFAFEPVPQNAATIRHNAELNQLDYVQVFELAIGERTGEQDLFLTEWDGGSSLLSSALKPTEPVRKQSVRVAPLDELIAREKIAPPDFIKLDVEGAELEALRGMATTLKEQRPVLLFEVDDGDPERFKLRHKELDEFVSGLGYSINHLPAAYANVQWTVGHSLCLPRTS
jgi:FkbM family methyltransferase